MGEVDGGGVFGLDDAQSETFVGTAKTDVPYSNTPSPMAWEFEDLDFINSLSEASPSTLSPTAPPWNMSASTAYSFPTASLRSLSAVTSSDEVPANSETSLDTRGNSITSIAPSGSGYSNLGDFEQLNSGHGTSANEASQSPLIQSTLSPTIYGMIFGDQSLPNAREMTETLSYEQHPFLRLEAEKAGGATSEPDTSIESDSHRFASSSQGSQASSSHIQLQLQDQSPYLQPRLSRTPWIEENLSWKKNPVVNAASQNILRADYLQFLEKALPRWKSDAFWTDLQSLKPTVRTSAFPELALAYSSVCQLEIRMVDDAIRNRIALIRLHLEYTKAYERQSQFGQVKTIGRSGASIVIDTILESIHKEWRTFDHKRKSDLRVNFHDRKRYGKRWLLLSDTLGPSILLMCSSKMANIVHNTTVTVKLLESIMLQVKTDQADTMCILQVMNPVTSRLFNNDSGANYDVDEIIQQIRIMIRVTPAGGEDHETPRKEKTTNTVCSSFRL